MVITGYGFRIDDNEIVFEYQNKELARFPITFNPLTGEQVDVLQSPEGMQAWNS